MTQYRTQFHRLGHHIRDVFIRLFPLEMKTPRGLVVRLRNRSEIGVYRHIFVNRGYPLKRCAGLFGGDAEPVVLDVGANNGQFAAAVFDQWPRSTVHSFEPQRALIPRIREFAERNGLEDKHIINWNAVGAESGTAKFYQNRDPISASLIREKAARRTVRRVVEVPVTTLDEYVHRVNLAGVDILKLDTEGVEIEVLAGARAVLEMVKVIFVELHPPFSKYSDAARILEAAGLTRAEPASAPGDDEQVDCVFIRKGLGSGWTSDC